MVGGSADANDFPPLITPAQPALQLHPALTHNQSNSQIPVSLINDRNRNLRELSGYSREVASYFAGKGLRYEKCINAGLTGIVFIMAAHDPANPHAQMRKFAVKTPIAIPQSDKDREGGFLAALRGSPHIVQLLGFGGAPNATESGEIGSRPVLITEYVPNGDLRGLIRRVAGRGGEAIPETVLWCIFLCRESPCPHFSSSCTLT
jgi:serine/threonine protein kinase